MLTTVMFGVALLGLLLSRRVRNGLMVAGRVVNRALNHVCAALSAGLDFVLRPREFDGSVSGFGFVVWVVMNGAAGAGIYTWGQSDLGSATYAAGALAAVHVLLVLATVLKF